MKHKDDILIDRFLREELTEEEDKEFRLKLNIDEKFRHRVLAMEEIKRGIRESVLDEKMELLKALEFEFMSERQNSQFKSELEEEHDSVKEPIENENNKKTTFRFRWYRYAAAAFIVTVLAFVGLNWDMSQDLALNPHLDARFEEFILHEVERSIESDYTSLQLKAYNSYALKNFKKAMPLLNELWGKERDTLALYYLGISHLMIGEKEVGNNILEKQELENFEKPN